MISLETAEFIKMLVSSFIGYIPVLTFVGVMSAWLASKLGDSTAKDEGWLSFNPWTHVDPFGLALLLVPPHVGFVRSIPTDPENIRGKFKKSRQLALFFVDMVAALVSLIISLFLVTVFLGFFSKTALSDFNDLPSFAISALLIFRAMIGASGFALIINLVYGSIKAVFFFYFPEHQNSLNYLFAYLILPLLIFILFDDYFNMLFDFLAFGISSFFHHILN